MKLDRITVNPDVCQGQPTIRGLRITVAFLMKQIAGGMAPSDILKTFTLAPRVRVSCSH